MRACDSCQRHLYKASGLLRCIDGRNISRCSRYVGSNRDLHIPLPWGAEYAESLTRDRGVTQLKIRKETP